MLQDHQNALAETYLKEALPLDPKDAAAGADPGRVGLGPPIESGPVREFRPALHRGMKSPATR